MQLSGIPRGHPGRSYRTEGTQGIAVEGIAKPSKNSIPFSSPTEVPEEAANVSSWF